MLLSRIDWLPLPTFSFFNDVAQAREGEVKGKNKGFIDCSNVHKPTPTNWGFLWVHVESCTPIGLRQMDRVEYRVGQAQEFFIF